MNRAFPRLLRPAALGVLLVAIGMLAACTTLSLPGTARNAFANDAKCPADNVTVRAWGGQDPSYGKLYEVVGCDKDVVYGCSRGVSLLTDGSGTAENVVCLATSYCTIPGCDSVELAARRAFVQQNSCPLERVSAAAHDPPGAPAPPEEIASDPERLRIWKQNQPRSPVGRTFMTASGCASEVMYVCQPPAYLAVPRGRVPSCMPYIPALASPGATTANSGPIGVKECDDYVAKWSDCYKDPPAKAAAKPGFDQMTAAWRTLAQTPQGRSELTTACQNLLAQIASAPGACH